jgi:hypothetical protein
MVDSGYIVPTGNLVVKGNPKVAYRNLGVATNGYPGRLAVREATDYDVKVSDGLLPPVGFIGYEQQALQYQVQGITTINVVDTEVPILSGGDFAIYVPGGLAKGAVATQGDPLLSWTAGQMISGGEFEGKVALKIPFTNSATVEVDTGFDLPAGVLVTGAMVQVTTAVAASTIDVGILSTESGGDADGFLDGVSCATAGFVVNTMQNTTDASNTLGALISDTIKSADSSAIYYRAPVPLLTDGTAKSITYTTNDKAIAGYIYLFVDSPGIKKVGTSGTTVSAAAADAGVFVESCI